LFIYLAICPAVSGAWLYVFLQYPFYLLVRWVVVGLGPKFLDNGAQLSVNRMLRNLHTDLVWGQG